ncbi:MAG: DUF4962 domain-containing protein, partial [Saprospiraceae bacterium]|nr:DUF4962 domain-containing protein [Saprospiraceae bacterium]
TNLSLAFHLTSDPKYLDAAVSQMKTVCAFTDWNPSHFLDVAEMTNGVAIGYDWHYNHMKKEEIELIRSGLKTKGLDEYKKAYDAACGAKAIITGIRCVTEASSLVHWPLRRLTLLMRPLLSRKL